MFGSKGILWAAVWAIATPALAAQPDVVTIAFVGDVMLDDGPGRVVRSGRDPLAAFSKILRTSDLRVGNLESVVSDKGKADPAKPYSFRAHPRTLKILKRHFDAVSLGNNHSGDYGPEAFADMLDRLERGGLAYFGGGRTLAAAHAPLILERRGLRLALLGYNEFFPRWFEADFDRPGVAWSEDEQVVLDIANARRVHRADLVIPFMHWGWEHETAASERQRRLARLMIDAGADAVIGGHPHVTQEIEIYRGKPIVYSLGNFVFDGFTSPQARTGWLAQLRLDSSGVLSLQIISAGLDREGLPRPRPTRGDLCWSKAQADPRSCDAPGRADQ